MYLLFRRGTVNGGQWGPVNDEQAAIVSKNLGNLAVAMARKMYPEAEVETVDVERDFQLSTIFAESKKEVELERLLGIEAKALLVGEKVMRSLRDPALWRADFDANAYLKRIEVG